MSVIEEIKQKLDIVEMVSQYGVALKKAGRTFKACCPFHTEKTPSFMVNPDRQTWHCFGACSTGGDAFAFVMRWEKLEFGQALRLLAERTGITLPTFTEDQRRDEPEDRLYGINESASLYFHHLLRSAPSGEQARRYLEGRAINAKTIEEWQLGYAAPGWEELSQYLVKRGYEIADIIAAGLLVEKEERGSYDRFRNRLMFPIFDRQGRVTGFGARALDDSLPKYLNSPQTVLFDKSKALYGINRAQNAIRKQDQAVIVEGFMDVLMAHQKGYNNVVASLGTALTHGQVEQLKGLTKSLVLALDADAAGEEATLRGLVVAQETMDKRVVYAPVRTGRTAIVRREEEYAEIKIAVLPMGKDPDEVLKQDPAVWERAVAEARPVVDYLLEVVSSKWDHQDSRGKHAVADSMLPFIAEIKNPISRNNYIQRLARITNIPEQDLNNQISAILRPPVKDNRPVTSQQPSSRGSADRTEDYCLSLLLRHPGLRLMGQELRADFFADTENRQIFQEWRKGTGPDEVWGILDDHLRPRLDALMAPEPPDPEESRLEPVFLDCRLQVEQRRLQDRIRQLGLLIQDVALGEDEEPELQHAAELLTLKDQLAATYHARRESLRAGRKGRRP